MTTGIKYVAYGAASGPGVAALAYIRALHRAGIPVWPFFQSPMDVGHGPAPLRLRRAVEGDANFADLTALMGATRRPIAYDTIVAQSEPDDWPRFAERSKPLIGYVAWETDALPAHWESLLNRADRVFVPCRLNAETFVRCGVTRPVRVVPHIRRNVPEVLQDGNTLRARLGIPADHFVFYTIGVWNPRKAYADLIDTFAREFSADDRVTLLVKTSSKMSTMAAGADSAPGIREQISRIVGDASRARGRPSANVVGVAASGIGGAVVEAIHAVGDAYVSLTHGEGWGLGAFDAATLGKPVIITGWGGHLDYLGQDYPGLVRYEMTQVEGWRPESVYRPTQRWATADRRHAAQLMRAALGRDRALGEAAARVRGAIAERYAGPVVAREFLAALE